MKTTKKIILTGVACCFYVNGLFAGGLLTNTNQSVHFLRNPARGASTEIDAVYTNPAGLAKLQTDGFHLSVNNQSAFQTRTITSTSPYFADYGGSETKTFKGEATAPVIPSLMAAYKKGKWVVSGYAGVIGGGGKLTFDKGLPSFETPISMIPGQLSVNGVTTTQYALNAFFEGSSYLFAGQLGGTFAFNEMFSIYAGVRINFASNGYTGYLKNISINPIHPALNPTGQMMLANTFFNNAAQATQAAFISLQPAIDGGAGDFTLAQMVAAEQMTQAQVDQLAGGLGLSPQTAGAMTVKQTYDTFYSATGTYLYSAIQTADKNVDCSQSGMGITPILGLNFNRDRLNIGVKYEFLTRMDIKNDTKVDNTGMFEDGVKTPNDIPALLTAGVSYYIVPDVKISAGYHHFFDSDAKMANDKQKFIDGGINEYQLGAEWQINKMFLISAGGQITRTGVRDFYQSDMSFSLNSYSVGFGGAVNVSESVRINVGYLFTNYADWKPGTSDAILLPGTETGKGIGAIRNVFSRTNKALGIGVDLRF